MSQRSRVLDPRLCWVVLLAFTLLSLVPAPSCAAPVGSRLSGGGFPVERGAQIETIRQTLEQQVVVQRLADFGLSPEEVAARLPTLSDDQLHQLAALSDDLAGGGTLEVVVLVLLIVFLVVVILKLADKEIIIK